jgi:hypothetical protein
MLARGLRNVDGEMDVDRVGYVAGFVLFDTGRIQYLWAPLEEAEQWRGETLSFEIENRRRESHCICNPQTCRHSRTTSFPLHAYSIHLLTFYSLECPAHNDAL